MAYHAELSPPISNVSEVRVLRVSILFPSLLKEYKDMLGVFYPRCNQPRTILIPSGAAQMQNFFQLFPLGWLQEIFIGQGLPFTS